MLSIRLTSKHVSDGKFYALTVGVVPVLINGFAACNRLARTWMLLGKQTRKQLFASLCNETEEIYDSPVPKLDGSHRTDEARTSQTVKLKMNRRSNKIRHSYSFPTVADPLNPLNKRHRQRSWLWKEIPNNETVYGCTANKLFVRTRGLFRTGASAIAGAWGACYEPESKSRRRRPLFEAATKLSAEYSSTLKGLIFKAISAVGETSSKSRRRILPETSLADTEEARITEISGRGKVCGGVGRYLVEELCEGLVIGDDHRAVVILEASMNYAATSALPQSAYPQFVVLVLPVLILLGTLRSKNPIISPGRGCAADKTILQLVKDPRGRITKEETLRVKSDGNLRCCVFTFVKKKERLGKLKLVLVA
ncbi:hypothetical protein WN51_08373 [Melipona quadrifasciata]|uniref:Uncharacterized protein n=1 Tax=Melipona quadrifasciata TaxID=166423 RepID=A0A0M9AB40_9HYME|nr:hypothetical protein WN51_08373 [Melipona quadrifasciata]